MTPAQAEGMYCHCDPSVLSFGVWLLCSLSHLIQLWFPPLSCHRFYVNYPLVSSSFISYDINACNATYANSVAASAGEAQGEKVGVAGSSTFLVVLLCRRGCGW